MKNKRLLLPLVLLLALAVALFVYLSRKPASSVVYEAELLKNGSFELSDEEGFPDNWLVEAYVPGHTASSFDLVEGQTGQGIKITNYSPNDARYFQTVKVSPNTTYLFSGYVKAQAEGGRGANLSIADVYAFSTAVFETEGGWQRVEFYGQTGPKQTDVTLFARLGGYSGEATGFAEFDNLSLMAVKGAPEGAIVQSWDKEAESSDTGDSAFGSRAPLLLLVMAVFTVLMAFLARFAQRLEGFEINEKSDQRAWLLLCLLLLVALFSRLFVMVNFSGFPVDVSAFRAWANDMARVGPGQFYLQPGHRDYPPGYMLLLWPLGLMGQALGTGATELLVKLPALLSDLGITVLLFVIAKKWTNGYAALALSALYAINPLTYLAGSAWGQVDSLPSLLLLVAVLMIMRRRWKIALPVYVLSVLMKPQALMVGPLGLLALVMDFVWHKEDTKAQIKEVLLGACLSVLLALAVALPFFNEQNGFAWLFSLYGNTMSYYHYATVNATNLHFLFGQNWVTITAAAPFLLRLIGAMILVLPTALYLIKQKDLKKLENLLSLLSMVLALCVFIPMSLQTVGIFLMLAVFALVFAMYLRGQTHDNLPLLAGILLTGFSVLGTMMHERYLFLAVALLTLAYIKKRDWRILLLLLLITALCFLNTGVALDRGLRIGGSEGNLDAPGAGLISDSAFMEYGLSALSLLITALCIHLGFALCGKDAKVLGFAPAIKVETLKPSLRFAFIEKKEPVRFDRKDAALILAVTLLYALLAFINLGATKAPQTPWMSAVTFENGAQESEVTLDLGEERDFKLLFYAGVHYQDSTFSVETSKDGEHFETYPFQVLEGDLFNWRYLSHPYQNAKGETVYDSLPRELTGRYVRISGIKNQLTLLEVIAQDSLTGQTIPFVSSTKGAEALIDEPELFEGPPSWYNSMYFDEIYHARSAYEQRNGILGIEPNVVYESSHPPLGKVLMTLSTFIFGMTPFGWRFAGALAGVLMLPGLYLLGKQLTRKRIMGLLAAGLFALDFMHFTQTRIATIDSFPTLFIIFAYFFMLRYISLDFVRVSLKKQLVPLFFSGLFMGLAIASKWTGMYAGAGLAVLFFISLIQNLMRAQLLKKANEEELDTLLEEKETAQAFGQAWPKTALLTCLYCLLFFIAIPALIYYLSYIPVYMSSSGGLTLEKVVLNNIGMFNYHSRPGLGADHPWASPWYSWPIIKKPMYFYSGGNKNGTASVIWSFGNPLIWWGGLLALVLTFLQTIKNRLDLARDLHLANERGLPAPAFDHRPQFLLIAFLAQYAPWILVPRGTYIYHYFPSVPFIILCMVLMVDYLYQKSPRAAEILHITLIVVAAGFFIAFFPYISGIRVSTEWLSAVRFIKNWLHF